MARGQHPTWHSENGGHGAGGTPPRRRSPSRGFLIGMGAVVMFGLFLAAMGAIAAQSGGGNPEIEAPITDETPIPVEVTVVPPQVTPDPEFTGALPTAGQLRLDVGHAEAGPTSSAVQSPGTVASSWSAGPTPVPPSPAPAVEQSVADLAAEASERYGVRIVVEGQDWGGDEGAQRTNIGAVISAIDRLPDTVISAVVTHPHGPLAFVSNDQGRTVDGWQPYGGHAMTYYTNSDQGPNGYHASNLVVVSVGSAGMSIGHEILHAYQFRNVNPDEYVLALLQPEMRSFMEATGWRQTGSDEQVRQAVAQPWSALDALFLYEGRALVYETTSGAKSSVTAANPVEAFAVVGSIYYTRPDWMLLPDWPEYWAWFDQHVG